MKKEQVAPSGFFRKGERETYPSKAGTTFSAFILRERHKGSLRENLEKSSLEISYKPELEVYSLRASGEL